MKNKRSIFILCLVAILLFGVIAGTLAAVLNRDDEPDETQTDKTDDGTGEQNPEDNRLQFGWIVVKCEGKEYKMSGEIYNWD